MALLRVFWFSVTCYFSLTCVLHRNAFGELTLENASAMINDTSQTDVKVIEEMRQSIEIQTKSDEITLKDSWAKSDALQESSIMRTISMKERISNNSRKTDCPRYCIRQLDNGRSNTYEGINLSWLFDGNQNETDKFSLINSPTLKISSMASDNKSSANLNGSCQIYLNLGCDITSKEGISVQNNGFYSNTQNIYQNTENFQEIFSGISSHTEVSRKIIHKTNLNGYTETKFHTYDNINRIVINIWGNLIRAVITIPTNRTMQRRGMTMSLLRTYDEKGVAIDAHNAPSGGWSVKLTGVADSKYNLDVNAYSDTKEENIMRDHRIIGRRYTNESNEKLDIDQTLNATRITGKIKEFNELAEKTRTNIVNNFTDSISLMNTEVTKKPKFVFERSAEIITSNNEDQTTVNNSTNVPQIMSFLPESTAYLNLINDNVLHNNSITDYSNFKTQQNTSDDKLQQKIQARSSEVASLNEDIDVNVKPFDNRNTSAKMTDNDKYQEFPVQSATNNEELYGRKQVLIEVNSNSELFAVPGTIHRVVFDVVNNCVLPVKYAIRARSSQFAIQYIESLHTWLYPGQTNYITVYMIVPRGVSQNAVNTLTLFVDGTKITEKTVYVYVQGALNKMIDDRRPTMEYSYNSNCAGKLDKSRCAKTFWSVDVTVRDYDSGLKRVISTPNDIYPRNEFISGTKEFVTFYYSATCCSTTARITAIDLLNNQYSRTIDVTAWDNLSEGEIAAIVVGTLFLLVLLILLILLIVYCVRKRSGHDLPYTQRYGSRTPARPERTSF